MSFFSPRTLPEAFAVLSDPTDLRILAGGTDVFPALGEGPPPARILDITRIDALRGLRRGNGGWRIGAAVTWRELLRTDMPAGFDGLKAAAREVGSVQIQSTGTVAGNLCNASPAADGVPPLLTLEAEVELASLQGVRRLPLADFLTGVRQTALRPGELLSAILIPDQPAGAGGAFLKLGSRRYLVISIVMVGAVVWTASGRIAGARIAVGAASPVAQRLTGLEAALAGLPVGIEGPLCRPEHLAGLAPIADVRGSAEYRREAVAELCDRTLRRALADG